MPPLLRSSFLLRLRSELLAIGVPLRASLQSQDASALWSCKGGGKTKSVKISRRNLFELHPGRQAFELPSELLLEKLSPPTREEQPFLHISPSKDLIDALGPIGLEYTVDPQYSQNKVDLSYITDPALLVLNYEEAKKKAREREEEIEIKQKRGLTARNLKGMLIQYLRHVDVILQYQARFKDTNFAKDKLDNALLELFNEHNANFLRARGYDVTDFMNWTWILSSATTERAAKRLSALAHQGFTIRRGKLPIPQFVFLLLLRRRDPTAEAVRSLLTYAWQMMETKETLKPLVPPMEFAKHHAKKISEAQQINEIFFMIMVIRLFRSARKVLPAAYDSIAALITRYLNDLNYWEVASQTTDLASEDIARLTFMYNTLLKLVSLPASVGPFQSAFYQQHAQFSLLRRMNEFQPPLIVDRRGYRAVVSMQLRHKKTLQEREWAQMKARSWPPWKEEKLGIDADIDVEHGTSRAMEVMRRSWEAGYAPGNWDAAASVLSGWDSDRSPTIQSRAIYGLDKPRGKSAKIWASRIRATRTLGEAWSCFLSFKDQDPDIAGASRVYQQMFEKIVQDAQRLPPEDDDSTSTNYTDEQQFLPGDGIEVSAAPKSPREAVYVRIPPPTVDEFVEMMAKDEVRPAKSFLNVMLRNAQTLENGLRYLDASTLPDAQVRFLSDGRPPSTPEDQATLEKVPNDIFASFIRMLTLVSQRTPDKQRRNQSAVVQNGPLLDSTLDKTTLAQPDSLQSPSDLVKSSEPASSPRPLVRIPLAEAIRLVLARRPRHRPTWLALLQTLVRRKVVIDVGYGSINQDYEDIKTWQIICRLLNEMVDIDLTLDLAGFGFLCSGLEKAIFACERLSRSMHKGGGSKGGSDDTMSYVAHVLSNGLSLLKQIFKDVVRSKSMQQEIPVSLITEKSRIDKSVEEQDPAEPDEFEEDIQIKPAADSGAFLPPGYLLPRLLEVPHPACLHAFVRVLGLRRDYDGLLDLVEWMCLFANDLNVVIDESLNGKVKMRRCLTAIRVFLERSWIILEKREAEARGEDPNTVRDELEMKAEPAPAGIVKIIQGIMIENKKWGGWPEPHEVVQYCANGNFL